PRALAICGRLERALAAQPDDVLLLLAAGKFERLRGNSMQALRSFRLAIAAVARAGRVDPAAAERWLGAAAGCLGAPPRAGAASYARDGIAWFATRGLPIEPRLQLALARALTGLGQLDDAIRILEAHTRVRPKDRDAARVLSSLLMGQALARCAEPKVTH